MGAPELLLKHAADYAPGLPDPKRFGRTEEIPRGQLLQYVVQEHAARRAGRHYDVRFGRPGDVGPLYSWATKKELPGPGEKRMLYQQALHRGSYARFEGELRQGYGAGTVKKKDQGAVIVSEATPDKIKFVVVHHKFPEHYTLLRRSGSPQGGTPRQKQTQGGSWLLLNTTPMDAARFLGGGAGLEKPHFASVPAAQVDKLFDGKYLVQNKIDGASLLFHLLSDRIEALSYRTSKGRPIIHTYRVFGPGGGKPAKRLPDELVGTVLRGETYGVRRATGQAIPPQELSGLLNSSVQKSLEQQQRRGIEMKNMLFDIVRLGRTPQAHGQLPAEQRLAELQRIAGYLNGKQFHLPETARSPAEARALWERIVSGRHPLTREGVVGWPVEGGPPVKAKLMPESDVWIHGIFPGKGGLAGRAAGGFEYSLAPGGPVAGHAATPEEAAAAASWRRLSACRVETRLDASHAST